MMTPHTRVHRHAAHRCHPAEFTISSDVFALCSTRSGKRFGWTVERGRTWGGPGGAESVDGAGHDRITEGTYIAPADRPFQPYSAALANCLDDMHLLTPDALASGDNFSPLQQARSLAALGCGRGPAPGVALCFALHLLAPDAPGNVL